MQCAARFQSFPYIRIAPFACAGTRGGGRYASMRRPDVTQQEMHWNNGPKNVTYIGAYIHTTISQDRDAHGCSFPSDKEKKEENDDGGEEAPVVPMGITSTTMCACACPRHADNHIPYVYVYAAQNRI